MNWLIWEKMFTYFYNKFRPVKRMHYIKCGVNLSHNSGYCIRSVTPWITVLLWHTVFIKRVIYYKFTFVWYSAKQGTTYRPTSHLAHCVPFLWPREEHRQQCSWVDDFTGQCLLRWLLLELAPALVVPLLLIRLPQNSLQNGWPPHLILSQCQQPAFYWWLLPQVLFFSWPWLWDPQSSALFTLCDWPELQNHYTSKDTNVFYSDNKTDLKLQCDCI